jgi:hypothetical protein
VVGGVGEAERASQSLTPRQ